MSKRTSKTTLARETRRKRAFERILKWSGVARMTDDERRALREALFGKARPRTSRFEV